jgi:YVTN family beta-propeller protein
VRGSSQEVASSLVASAGLEATATGAAYSDTVPAGLVTSQTPAPGTVVPRGLAVEFSVSLGPKPPPTSALRMKVARTITGRLSAKSVVASQVGQVFAQNMIYTHTISVFDDKTYALLKTIPDKVVPADFGFPEYTRPVIGGPVEAAATPDGKYMYVSQYSMYGPGFSRPGDDKGSPSSGVDPSFVYRVRLDTLVVDQLIKVGSVPKFVAVTPDGRYLLVSNWISYSLSVVDTATGREVKEIRVGAYPRGIAVDPTSRIAYVAVMGSNDVAKVDLQTFGFTWLRGVGSGPRHLNISPDGAFLYVTLNGAGKIAKIDLATGKVLARVSVGSQPRSMTLSADGESLYVVNYASNTVSKVRTSDMKELQQIGVGSKPIGITYVNATGEIWVACYSGSIIVLRES